MERIFFGVKRTIISKGGGMFIGAAIVSLLVSGELSVLAKNTDDINRSPGRGAIFSLLPVGTKLPEGVLSFENEGQTHISPGDHVTYKTDPPTSGPHYDKWAPAGIYEAGEVQPELLVHNLEHGNIVIYFDRSVLSKAGLDELIALQKKYTGQWDGVLLVGRKDKEKPLILTAWRAMLPLKTYNKEKILMFIDVFRGRGPEKSVR